MKNIAIVAGGYTSEFGVSLRSAEGLMGFIDGERYNCYTVIISKKRWSVMLPDGNETDIDRNDFSFVTGGVKVLFDFAYITIHGSPGEDGRIQGYFDMIGLPYSSCGVLAGALTFNKYFNNQYLKSQGIRVADSVRLTRLRHCEERSNPEKIGINGLLIRLLHCVRNDGEKEVRNDGKVEVRNDREKEVRNDGKEEARQDEQEWIRNDGNGVFVKPNEGGSSFGITKVTDAGKLQEAVDKAFEESDEVIIEQAIKGVEVTCGCYKTKKSAVVFPITEIVSENEFFDYDAKYNGKSQEITPARISGEMTDKIKRNTLKIYDLIGARGIIRIDYIIPDDGEPVLLEINTNPGMTTASLIPQQIKAEGLDIKDIMTDIIENS
ncbi:MAG: D-alanine--D-alanine ligase [Tannerella sp.]|jgi:D-alanine-D-alanine ligase|nr:D-alanine--D-alanine ligase [Tannerella sp.]